MPRIPRTLPSLRAFAAPSPSSSSLLTPLARPTPATASSFSRALSTPSLFRPTALTALTSLSSSRRPTLSPSSALASLLPLQQGVFQPTGEQVRTAVYGAEYQPSQIKRKRKHGFLGRLRTKNGRKTLKNRWNKGRKYLSH